MFAAVSEEMIDTMYAAGTAHEVREQLRRYEGVLDHIMRCIHHRLAPLRNG